MTELEAMKERAIKDDHFANTLNTMECIRDRARLVKAVEYLLARVYREPALDAEVNSILKGGLWK